MQPPPSQRNATYQATNLQVEERILERWDKKIHGDRLKTKHSGCYYMFESLDGSISVEGGDDMTGSSSDIEADTPCIVLSIAKAITGTAVMRTMHLRPADWYPEKAMHRFKGWEAWRDFDVHDDAGSGCGRRSEVITIHQLLTHTSGFPFGLRGSRSQIRDTALYYMPGTGCGYSIGHRILGWMLLDYWRDEARAKRVSGVDEFKDLQAVYTYLIYDPLGMASTRALRGLWDTPHSILGEFFNMQALDKATDACDDDPADISVVSTATDLMNLALLVLRRGKLANNETYIARWEDWVGKNQLPEGKSSAALASWRVEGANFSANLSLRSYCMRSGTGPHGFDYFGRTCHNNAGDVVAVRIVGISNCGVRIDYEKGFAFVVMQECLWDSTSRNLAECAADGKVYEFSLSQVADVLVKYPAHVRKRKRANYVKDATRLTNVPTQVDQPDLMLRLLQCALRSFYWVSTPLAERYVLRFDDRDRLWPRVRLAWHCWWQRRAQRE